MDDVDGHNLSAVVKIANSRAAYHCVQESTVMRCRKLALRDACVSVGIRTESKTVGGLAVYFVFS